MREDELNNLAYEKGMQANDYMVRGDYESALKSAEEAEQIYRKIADNDGLQKTLGYQAMILVNAGEDLQRAKALLSEQERICIDIGSQEGLGLCRATQDILKQKP